MLLGFNLLLWTTQVNESHAHLLTALKNTGYDGVEIPVFSGDPELYYRVGKMSKDQGLRLTGVGVIPGLENNLASRSREERERGASHLSWLVECCEAAGLETLCGPFYQPLGEFTGVGPTEQELEWVVNAHQTMANAAKRSGIRLSVEPLNRFECYLLNTCEQAARLVQQVGTDNYGFLYDTFHQGIEEYDPVGAIAENFSQINHVHLSENNRGTPGRGHVPWRETLKAFKSLGYDGWYVIEAFGRAMPEIAAATRVWRDLSVTPEDVFGFGHDFLRRVYEEV